MTSQGGTLGWAAVGGAAGALVVMATAILLRPPSGFPLPALQTPATPPSAADVASSTPTGTTTSFTPIPILDVPANLPAAVVLGVTPTADAAVATIAAGGLEYLGPLSHAQQVSLFRTSVGYAQTTVAESVEESRAINGVGYGDPDTICGPLAIAILRTAGLLPAETVPHDFWLLDPSAPTDKEKLAQVFPVNQYAHITVRTAIDAVDWSATPLEPGDFVYIWHGSGGNFDHMLVVNRVDRQKRAYAVTNFGTTAGYIIAETMLYDPADRSAGIFHEWTKEKDAILGSTGFGGYEVWRLHGE